ncbi:myo-inositol-1(or 4)-monophosphatase [Rhizobiales bacterium GAS191]|nr:myo-inositol-1(or 4)-monophosphatase [Rhizobiales bacterium GAS191]
MTGEAASQARTSSSDLQQLIGAAAREAGALAMRWFRPGQQTAARSWTKGKSSPVTEADIEVDAFLRARLAAAGPECGWLSEETVDSPERLSCGRVFVVDPIDGTRAFIGGDARWCVSIALVEDGVPVAAVVHAPALDLTHEATAHGRALLNGSPISASPAASLAGASIAGPRFMLDRLVAAGAGILPTAKIPSLAHRLCKVADASLDIALASQDAHDWDIAAAHLILERAGGKLADFEGVAPRYNRETTIHGNLLAAPAAGFDAVLAELGRVIGLPKVSGLPNTADLPNTVGAATERS